MENIKQLFQERLPYRPYCSNELSQGLIIRPTHDAVNYRHLQPNPPHALAWLVFDLDYAGSAFGWEKANLPPPTIIATNPANAHAHLFYGLRTPVCLTDNARGAPIRYASIIQAVFTAKLLADTGYAGLIAKNPLHNDWRVTFFPCLYDLGELAEYVVLPKTLPAGDRFGLGRNCLLFDELRAWSYTWVREYKKNGATSEQWRAAVIGQGCAMNEFSTPLAESEVKGIGKSIAKWTWREFSESQFSLIQSRRGKLGGRPKTTTLGGNPWDDEKISRATYYRRLKRQQH